MSVGGTASSAQAESVECGSDAVDASFSRVIRNSVNKGMLLQTVTTGQPKIKDPYEGSLHG